MGTYLEAATKHFKVLTLTWLVFFLAFGLSREAASSAARVQRAAVGHQDADKGRREVGEPVAAFGLLTDS